jgi:hypothetical protein
MARIIEFRTINIAVPDWEKAASDFAKLGLPQAEPHVFPEPPAQMVDVAFRIPSGGGWSLISPVGENSPVSKFLAKRGPGIYSMTLRVDNLAEAMKEWSERGLQWVRPEPAVFPDAHVPPWHVERLLMNWIKPSSLGGILVEVVEFAGKMTRHGE